MNYDSANIDFFFFSKKFWQDPGLGKSSSLIQQSAIYAVHIEDRDMHILTKEIFFQTILKSGAALYSTYTNSGINRLLLSEFLIPDWTYNIL